MSVRRELAQLPPAPLSDADRMTSVMERALETVPCDFVLVPTRSGATARLVSRLKAADVADCTEPRSRRLPGTRLLVRRVRGRKRE